MSSIFNASDATTITESPASHFPVESRCPRQIDRRAFLRDMSLVVAGSLVAWGITPADALALSAHEMVGEASLGLERTYPIPASDGVWIDSANSVVLARVGAQLFAFSLECPHRGRALEWLPADRQFYCPKHKARFTAGGAHASGRRTTDLDRYAVRRVQGKVSVLLDQVISVDTDPAGWAAAVLIL